jgi:hypothetical protein
VLYLYAIVEAPFDATAVDAGGGKLLVVTPQPGLAVVGAEIERPPDVSAEALRAQDAIVRALHDRSTALLPMRFGATATDIGAVTAAITQKAATLREQLAFVRGREQMTLRILGGPLAAHRRPLADEGPHAAPSGTDYLLARRPRVLPPELSSIAAPVEPIVRSTRFESGRQAGVAGTVYHLIDRGSALAYRHAIAKARVGDFRVRVSGPSPAYAFTS